MITHAEIDNRLKELTGLQHGWDGYGAEPISDATIAACCVVARALVDIGRHISITPTSTETLEIGWMEGDLDCIAEINAV